MRLAIVGSRSFNDFSLLERELQTIRNNMLFDITQIVSGGAKGADSLAEQYANKNGISSLIILPDWNKYGKSAGFRRNNQIVDNSDLIVAFWDGKSKGTEHTIKLAKKAKKLLKVVQV